MNPMVATLQNMMRPVATPVVMAWERLESGISYNPLSPAIRADPYPVYERLRRKDPVHRMRLYNGWLLTKFEDVDAVLRNAKVFGKLGSETGYLHPRVSMLDLDPPEHTKIRALVSRAFTPRSVAALEPRIRDAMDGLLANIENKKRFDVMAEVAFPLPIIVIAEMLGSRRRIGTSSTSGRTSSPRSSNPC